MGVGLWVSLKIVIEGEIFVNGNSWYVTQLIIFLCFPW